jgi:hypothetical protein
MPLPLSILELVRTKSDPVAILDDGLTGDVDVETTVKSIVDSQLMTVQLKLAVVAVVDEDRRFCYACSDRTVFEVF